MHSGDAIAKFRLCNERDLSPSTLRQLLPFSFVLPSKCYLLTAIGISWSAVEYGHDRLYLGHISKASQTTKT